MVIKIDRVKDLDDETIKIRHSKRFMEHNKIRYSKRFIKQNKIIVIKDLNDQIILKE